MFSSQFSLTRKHATENEGGKTWNWAHARDNGECDYTWEKNATGNEDMQKATNLVKIRARRHSEMFHFTM